jgi:4-alpha-glucanotransferase
VTDAWGITDGYHDNDGTWHETSPEVRRALREVMGDPDAAPPAWCINAGDTPRLWSACTVRLEDGTERGPFEVLPADLPLGYHELVPDNGGPTTFLVVAPRRVPDAPTAWGVAAQLYSLRSEGSQGIGDLADLAALLRWAHPHGAGAVLLSPLHAPSPSFPQQDSPYYPSSRRWRNPLHLRVPDLPEDSGPALIDRDRVWRIKRSALQSWFLTSAVGEGWRRWVEAQGESLEQYAIWCTVAERHGPDWRSWPDEYRTPNSAGLTSFDLTDPDVEFHSWCQWLLNRQLAEARRSAPDIALVGDLAVGFDTSGADAWAYQDCLALDWRIGAPPDLFNAEGQDWGLPPFNPIALRSVRYQPFIDTVRAALRGFSGLRIDHVMGLFRLWWVPPGARASEGVYVRQQSDVLLGIVRLEAHRAGAFLIGEDLGTVEPGVREAMADAGILGTRVAWFESEPPTRWPEQSLGTITTHDLPTVSGVWQGRDGDRTMAERLAALSRSSAGALADDVVLAMHELLARSPARIRLATLEDLTGAVDRPNVPGTVTEHPNWRRRLPVRVDDLDRQPLVRASVHAFQGARRG